MKNIDYSNQMQKEAILNECKGNLFEFLVTQGLAARSLLESEFLLSLPADFKSRLADYEQLVRTHEPKLLTKLPVLATSTVDAIWEKLQLDHSSFSQWNVIGKMVATNDTELWNETDIVGTYTQNDGLTKKLALSLKLTKDHSYTNTKSAGVKSFLSKYFQGYDHKLLADMQRELNHEVDESFLMMGHRLYQMADMEFKGSFNSKWSDTWTELPGELPAEMREVVHENYHRVALKLSHLIEKLKKENPILFFESLYALCGYGNAGIIQVNCVHQDYDLREITIKSFEDFFSNANAFASKECILMPLKHLASSLEVHVGSHLLQIRVKPMNKFTTAAYKINCSIKVKS